MPSWKLVTREVMPPTQRNSGRDAMPYADIRNSIAAKSKSTGTLERCDIQPPAKPPKPSPIMKAATTTVTDSIFTP